MNRIQIYFWHSDNLKDCQKQKLQEMGMYSEGGGRYIANMTPAEFVEKWNENVLLLAPNKTHKEWIIGVTGCNSFNPC